MDKSFHYLLMVTQSLFQRKVFSNLADTDLTIGQPKILDYLGKHNGSMQKDIANGCQIDTATLTGLLSRMEEKKLIVRKMENNNRRSSYVYLTDKGRESLNIVNSTFNQVEKEVLHGINPEDVDTFMNVLYKICSNMTNLEELQ
ncbi:MAG: MarR family transcriptional regulator [Ruminococcus sp.]|nr:MarR family transcriptional regulator [Ruminococcus sp.]